MTYKNFWPRQLNSLLRTTSAKCILYFQALFNISYNLLIIFSSKNTQKSFATNAEQNVAYPSEESSHTVQLEMSIWKCQNISKNKPFETPESVSACWFENFQVNKKWHTVYSEAFLLIPLFCPNY